MHAIDTHPITPKQKEILLLLYRFRYLTINQFQKMLGHRSKGKIKFWLKDLLDKNYVRRLQMASYGALKAPYVYYAGDHGIACLRARSDTTELVLRRLKHDRRAGREFIASKVLIADIASGLNGEQYEIATSSSIANPDSAAYWLYQMGISPDLVVRNESGQIYLLEVFVSSVPGYAIRKRIKLYLEAQVATDWDLRFVIVCDNRAQRGIIYRATRQLRDRWQIVLKDEKDKIIWH